MRIFLDANVLFSAALDDSRMAEFLAGLFETATCLTNEYAIEEARRNIASKYPTRLAAFERLLKRCEVVSRLVHVQDVALPEKDIPILSGAIAAGATRLLTGDQQHFGKHWGKVVRDVKIVSPRMLAEELGWL